jgi:hypothetical protein
LASAVNGIKVQALRTWETSLTVMGAWTPV